MARVARLSAASAIAICILIPDATRVTASGLVFSPSVSPIASEGYYGEEIRSLSPAANASFERGYRLFITNWPVNPRRAHNATSCLVCHNTPMAGGSGIFPMTLVRINDSHSPGDRLEMVQRFGGPTPSLDAPFRGSVRRTPALFGLGLLFDWKNAHAQSGSAGLGAYGRVTTLEQFVSLAFADELGESTPYHCARAAGATTYPTVCHPDVSEDQLEDIVHFIQYLAPPPVRARAPAKGRMLFRQIRCNSCHLINLRSLNRQGLEAPFTDFQMHQLGQNPASRVRTAALWGLTSVGPPYLHDASASSIEAAVLAHSGEASPQRTAYQRLSVDQRLALLHFLSSL
jgi:hypothetical protein